jgi:Ig-like domain CHU_C associated
VPQITTQPQNVTIPSGSTTLTVAANTAGVTYQWYTGTSGTTTSPISGATGTSLTVSPASTTSYWARATSTCGRTVDSATATVTICQTPAITRQPYDAGPVYANQMSYTDVIATGTNLTYQWYFGESGDTSNPINCGRDGCQGSTSSSLNIYISGSVRVWVRVSGMCGAMNSNAAWLSVWPGIYQQPPDTLNVGYGSSANLYVGAGGTALHYAWKWGNGTPVSGAPDSPTLILPTVTANALVYCDVTSGAATRSTNGTSIVICDGPYITSTQVTNSGSCRYINVSVLNPYMIDSYTWYQGPRGDTSHPQAGYFDSYFSVCPTSPTTYWCRVAQGGCYSDTQAVAVP